MRQEKTAGGHPRGSTPDVAVRGAPDASAGAAHAALSAAVLESLADALVVTTFTGQILYLNSAAKRLLGTSLNAVRGRALAEVMTLLDGTTHAPVGDPLARFLSRSGTGRNPDGFDQLLQRNGTTIPLEDSCATLHDLHGEAAGFILTLRDATTLRALAREATHDPLTQLVNRQEFERRLNRLLASLRPGHTHALLYMDLDRFKEINDTHGHVAGDEILRQVAAFLRTALRTRDTLARLGGDEFAALLEHCPLTNAEQYASTLARDLDARLFRWRDRAFRLGVSIGAVAITERDRDPAALLAAADRACYAAKRRRVAAPGPGDATPAASGFFPWTLV